MSSKAVPMVQVDPTLINAKALESTLDSLLTSNIAFTACGLILLGQTLVYGIDSQRDATTAVIGLVLAILGLSTFLGAKVLRKALGDALVIPGSAPVATRSLDKAPTVPDGEEEAKKDQ